MKNQKKFLVNIMYAFFAQGVSLILSILITVILPKLLDVKQYGFWQLFVFYSSYVGFFHLGLNDGVYLRLGGKQYEKLDYSLMGGLFRVSLIVQMIFAIAILSVLNILSFDSSRKLIVLYTAVYMVIFNAAGYLGYILQAVNKTKYYSISVMVDKIFFIISLIFVVTFSWCKYEILILLFILGKCLALLYVIYRCREIVFAKRVYSLKRIFGEIFLNVEVGINLLVANIASMLILGISRQIIDLVWGIEVFGKISFSLTLTNFFLLFIGQISMVMFPTLREVSSEKKIKIYESLSDGLTLFLPIIFLGYIPLKLILGVWLPQYKDGLEYLVFLLPICIFDGKMQILCNTYFKVLREEKLLLKINIFISTINIILSSFAGFIVNNLVLMMIFMVSSIVFRSVIAEIYLSKIMNVSTNKNLIYEIILTILFVIISISCNDFMAFVLFGLIYTLFLLSNRVRIMNMMTTKWDLD